MGKSSRADNVSGIIDPSYAGGFASNRACVQVNELVLAPKKGMAIGVELSETRRRICGYAGNANHLATVVEATHETDGSPQGAEVEHFAVLPEKRLQGRNPRNGIGGCTRIGYACDLATLVDIGSKRVGATQRTQILHLPVLPEECPGLLSVRRKGIEDPVCRESYYLAPVVDAASYVLI